MVGPSGGEAAGLMGPREGVEDGVRSAAGAVSAAVSCSIEVQTTRSRPWVCVVSSHERLLDHSLAVPGPPDLPISEDSLVGLRIFRAVRLLRMRSMSSSV